MDLTRWRLPKYLSAHYFRLIDVVVGRRLRNVL